MRIVLRAALMTLPVMMIGGALVHSQPAKAQATNFRQEYEDIKNAIPGLGTDRSPIDFTERAPLVVPPSNNLPPPQEVDARLGVNDPDVIDRHKALSDPRRPVPLTDPGATATGASARAYLIQPPSGMMDPAAAASEAKENGFVDNKKHKKKATGLAAIFGGGHKKKRTPDPSTASTAAAQ